MSTVNGRPGVKSRAPKPRGRAGDGAPRRAAKRMGTPKGVVVSENGDAGPTMTVRAYHLLEEMIVTLQLHPGMVLSELVLSRRLKMGRTPIREALQRLARDGLVLILPRRGVLVSDVNVGRQLRLLEVRRELERLLARLASERATPEEAKSFSEVADGMLRASRKADDLEFMRLDRELNTLVSQAARNEFVSRFMYSINGLSRRFWYQHYKEVADLPLAAKLHANLATAIASRDGAAAERASDALIDYIESFARKTLTI